MLSSDVRFGCEPGTETDGSDQAAACRVTPENVLGWWLFVLLSKR